jgi:TolB-like protein/Flp pilus assembly protein TadD
MGNFFAELKRRNVYKVAVVYAVVAWLLIQAASILFPTFDAPAWVMKVFIATIAFGFPLALILAWAFELTPEGIKRADMVSPPQPIGSRGRGKLVVTVVAIALLAATLFAWQFLRKEKIASTGSSTAADSKSLAVLPFENLSSDKENAFFAQGIQDEIITTLSKISGLRVISRTSTAQYQSKPQNLSEIARELRVGNILEGSVQKVGDRTHINVQLIQAETDAHLWAQSYDRQLTDIFSVEAEVAKSVADSLRATLTPQEKARVESKPTSNPDAYVLYLQGREYQNRPDTLLHDFKAAVTLYERAIALDPNFALAHARLSVVLSQIYHWFEPVEARKLQARHEAEEALRLQPNMGEAHLALGLSYYYEESNYEEALREFDIAARTLPNDADVVFFSAAVRRRQGRWKDAIATYKKAEAVDPRNQVMIYDAAQTYYTLRDWPAAAEVLDQLLKLAPDSITGKIQRAYIEFVRKGSTAPIKSALQTIPPNFDPDGTVTFARWDVSLIDRDAAAAAKAVTTSPLGQIISPDGTTIPKSYLQASIDLMQGNSAKAMVGLETTLPAFEAMVNASPEDHTRHARLGLLYAFMGRNEDALREGRRAVELKPVSKDAIDGPTMEAFLCLIYARLGTADEAIPLIERILARPGGVDYAPDGITLSDLRLRWEWDPLRKDPRFQKILADPEPKTIY